MKTADLVRELNLTLYAGEQGLDREVRGGYAGDLLSDVMGFAAEGDAWITLQTHQNVVAIASLKELAAIILVKGFLPGEDTVAQSNKESVPLLGTTMGTFETAGRLHRLLNP